jgi:CDP-2,3-bis-(O-geranylgeranyl)-sn-glycerol synthase
MAGDLFSSFFKRRIGLPASSRALGLDQIPESMFPLAISTIILPLSYLDVLVGTALFVVLALLFSRVFFALGLRDRPH